MHRLYLISWYVYGGFTSFLKVMTLNKESFKGFEKVDFDFEFSMLQWVALEWKVYFLCHLQLLFLYSICACIFMTNTVYWKKSNIYIYIHIYIYIYIYTYIYNPYMYKKHKPLSPCKVANWAKTPFCTDNIYITMIILLVWLYYQMKTP